MMEEFNKRQLAKYTDIHTNGTSYYKYDACKQIICPELILFCFFLINIYKYICVYIQKYIFSSLYIYIKCADIIVYTCVYVNICVYIMLIIYATTSLTTSKQRELGTTTAIKITALKILSQASLFLQSAHLVIDNNVCSSEGFSPTCVGISGFSLLWFQSKGVFKFAQFK